MNKFHRKYYQRSAPRREEDPVVPLITRINELSTISRTVWFGLLSYVAFAGVTLLGVDDADFFIESRRTLLPVVGVDIPTRDFFIFGPILGTALFVYFHLYLLKLWEALAAPAASPRGEALSVQVIPWLVNDLGLALRGDGAARARPMDWLAHVVTFALVFGVGPLTIGAFWIRYWPAHEASYSILAALLFTLALMTAMASLFTAVMRLRFGLGYRGGWWHLLAFIPTIVIGSVALTLTIAKTKGEEAFEGPFWPLRPISVILSALVDDGLSMSRANLVGVELVAKPEDWKSYDAHLLEFREEWCGRQDLSSAVCGQSVNFQTNPPPFQGRRRSNWCDSQGLVDKKCQTYFRGLESRFISEWKTERLDQLAALTRLDLRGRDLRFADLSEAFLPGVDFRGARLTGVLLNNVVAEYARFEDTELKKVVADGADFRHARMARATLTDVSFREAKLQLISFHEKSEDKSEIANADFYGSELNLSNFSGAQISNSKFDNTKIVGSDFSNSNITSSRFTRLDVFDAKFGGSQVTLSDFWYTKFFGGSFTNTKFMSSLIDNTVFNGSRFYFTSFSGSLVSNTEFFVAEGEDLPSFDGAVAMFPNRFESTSAPVVASCWNTEPDNFEALLQLRVSHSAARNTPEEIRREFFRKRLLCN